MLSTPAASASGIAPGSIARLKSSPRRMRSSTRVRSARLRDRVGDLLDLLLGREGPRPRPRGRRASSIRSWSIVSTFRLPLTCVVSVPSMSSSPSVERSPSQLWKSIWHAEVSPPCACSDCSQPCWNASVNPRPSAWVCCAGLFGQLLEPAEGLGAHLVGAAAGVLDVGIVLGDRDPTFEVEALAAPSAESSRSSRAAGSPPDRRGRPGTVR